MTEDQTGHDVISWGGGEFGQHGHQVQTDVSFHDGCLPLPGQVKMVACGSGHTVAVTVDDEIFVWGSGASAQLGTGLSTDQPAPTRISLGQELDTQIASVACGSRHTVVTTSRGQVFAFGNNFHAQLGYDFKNERYKESQKVPCLLRYLLHRPVVQVSCGDKHSVFLFQHGVVATVGHNAHGQLGDYTRHQCAVPKDVDLPCRVTSVTSGRNHNLVITEGGDVYVWGYSKGCGYPTQDVLSPELKFQGHKVVQLAAGSHHSMALTATGDVYAWGSGPDGQLGLGVDHVTVAKPRRIKDNRLRHRVSFIGCGESYSAAITCEGRLHLWGRNSHVISTSLPPSHKFFQPMPVGEESSYRQVSSVCCGSWHAVALTGPPARAPCNSADDSSDSETSEPELTFDTSQPDNNPRAAPVACGLQERGRTRLTLEEFYSLAEAADEDDCMTHEEDQRDVTSAMTSDSCMDTPPSDNGSLPEPNTNIPDEEPNPTISPREAEAETPLVSNSKTSANEESTNQPIKRAESGHVANRATKQKELTRTQALRNQLLKTRVNGIGTRANTMFISTSTSERFLLPRQTTTLNRPHVTLVAFDQVSVGVTSQDSKDSGTTSSGHSSPLPSGQISSVRPEVVVSCSPASTHWSHDARQKNFSRETSSDKSNREAATTVEVSEPVAPIARERGTNPGPGSADSLQRVRVTSVHQSKLRQVSASRSRGLDAITCSGQRSESVQAEGRRRGPSQPDFSLGDLLVTSQPRLHGDDRARSSTSRRVVYSSGSSWRSRNKT
ncbi:X-linked retinitis pigmentosa GTPase regulator-like [Physella acuta]|uniref:X-linked retinitis pigmentosa GTPase regulator-like n=1 Tax=Physella acuta TaxID=109671 RepID=UPI0027DDF263|nr:X-linked retinitis pigmentosa GTPase regulator-like [Physella acuta]